MIVTHAASGIGFTRFLVFVSENSSSSLNCRLLRCVVTLQRNTSTIQNIEHTLIDNHNVVLIGRCTPWSVNTEFELIAGPWQLGFVYMASSIESAIIFVINGMIHVHNISHRV